MRAILASLRIANAPSVVSNVTLGFILGGWYWGFWGGHDSLSLSGQLVILCLIGLLLLFGGNLLNDWHDRDWDATHRPERALPSGKFPPRSFLIAAIACLFSAVGLAVTFGTAVFLTTLGITTCIVVYTLYHKRHAWSVIPMAACRAGLYLLGFLLLSPLGPVNHLNGGLSETIGIRELLGERTFTTAFILTHFLGLFAYVIGLSLNARYESLPSPPAGMLLIARVLLVLPLATHSAWWIPYYPLVGALSLLPLALWLALSFSVFRKPLPTFVSALLAGIPLIDFIASVPAVTSVLGPDQSISDQPVAVVGVVVPLAAFAMARLLQKLAPAT